ncbi:prepilin-type N-terminal cleavage/methylation domain-containing protein [Brevundimonas denitrificans]|uniref:prepilin-type N-terminal cleavage/methylation domain-containing protein n=1 Tax=Brevundimonas denitrificans TaxID=1443434 RepID=UPI00352C3DB7
MSKPEQAQTARRRKRAGFTLVEVMVVVVIIGLLATVVVITSCPPRTAPWSRRPGPTSPCWSRRWRPIAWTT